MFNFPCLCWPGAGLVTIGLLIVLSGVLSVIRFHGFRLDDRGDRLVSTGGLLDQREQTVRRPKITGLTLKQSALGRLMGSWYLIVRQATSSDADPTRERTNFVVPGLRTSDRELTGELLPGVVLPESFEGISAGFRRIYWLRWFILFLLVLGILWIALGVHHWTLLVTPPVMLLLLTAVHLRWRRWGFSIQGDQVWVRSGLLGQSLDAIDLNLVQQVRLIQSPWQRRHNLANLQLILPQGTVTVPFIDEGVAAGLANRALYAAETALTHRV
jgi:putative membrane protein